MTTRYRCTGPLGIVIVLKRSLDNQNLRHTSPFQMAITLEVQGFVEAYLGDSWDYYFLDTC